MIARTRTHVVSKFHRCIWIGKICAVLLHWFAPISALCCRNHDSDVITAEIFSAKTDQNECTGTRKSDFMVRALDEEFCVLKKFPHVVVSLEQLTGTICLLFSISK